MLITKEAFIRALQEDRIFFTLAYMDRKIGKRGWRVYIEDKEVGICELKNLSTLYKPHWGYYRLLKAEDSTKTIMQSIMNNLGISEQEVKYKIRIL